MQIKRLQVGPIGTNCYLLKDEGTKQGAIIDPGDEADRILRAAQEMEMDVQMILLTHGHYDHTTGVSGILKHHAVPVYIHRDEVSEAGGGGLQFRPIPQLHYYQEGDELPLGELAVRVLHTPGHSRGSVTLQVGEVLFTGDTLFRDSCGRTDFPGGSFPEILRSLKRLYDLPGEYQVCPGHEAVSTLSRERTRNPFMREAVRQNG